MHGKKNRGAEKGCRSRVRSPCVQVPSGVGHGNVGLIWGTGGELEGLLDETIQRCGSVEVWEATCNKTYTSTAHS